MTRDELLEKFREIQALLDHLNTKDTAASKFYVWKVVGMIQGKIDHVIEMENGYDAETKWHPPLD